MPANNSSGESSIFFAKAPDLCQLCTITCRVSDSDSDAPSSFSTQASSNSHSQQPNRGNQSTVLKCRQLIFTEPRVLASPSLPDGGYISVVCSRAFWSTGKLQEKCQKMSLQYGEPKKVYAAVFQVCFCYTLKAKLAPLWNKVGEYYVQGRDFITSTGLLGAVNLEINISEGEISFAVKPQTIKLPHCTLQEFGISSQNIAQFLCDTSSVISEYFIGDRFCFVLPSMKKGRVVSLMHNLPASSPFKTYSDLRRYWKNTYGYRLPESGEGLVYLEIFFPAIRNTLFTYPEFCIRMKEPQRIKRVDPAPILAAFLADVRRKFPSMCDNPMELTRKAMYTAVTMSSAVMEETSPSSVSCVSLVSQPAPRTRQIPTRSLVSLAECYKKHPDCPLPSHQPPPYHSLSGQQKNIMPTTGYIIKTQLDQRDHATLSHTHPHQSRVQERVVSPHLQGQRHGCPNQVPTYAAATGEHFHGHSSTPHDPRIAPDQVGIQSSVACGNPETVSMAVYRAGKDFHVPTTAAASMMKKRLPDSGGIGKQQAHTMFSMAAHLQSKSQQDAGDVQRSFEPSTCLHGQSSLSAIGLGQPCRQIHGQLSDGSQRQRNHVFDISESSSARKPPPFVPIFKPKPTLSHITSEHKAPAGPKIKPTFTARKPKRVTPSTRTVQHKEVAGHPSAVHPTQTSLQPSEDVIPPTQPQVLNHTSGLIKVAQSTSAFSAVGQGKSGQFIRGPSVQQPVNSLSNETPARKRKVQEQGEAGKAKKTKVRSKPKIQDHSMVQLLAQNDQLSKVNSVTLAAWLKEKGVPVSSKDKKSDLVTKVMTYINCTTTES
ncbi:uncharacterized protein [Diadema antillarum]|uniref:uncharacterized protein n=1 Tax=Diadema antillarum TaxID=105358 RepID=UPI003A88AE6E